MVRDYVVSMRRIAHAAEVEWSEDEPAADFMNGVISDWDERGYDESEVELEAEDLMHEIADNAASSVPSIPKVAEIWASLSGWNYDVEVRELGGSNDSNERMRIVLYLVAIKMLQYYANRPPDGR